MKKILLSLLTAALTLTASAGQLTTQKRQLPVAMSDLHLTMPFEGVETVSGPQRAAGTMIYTLADDPYQFIGFKNTVKGQQIAQAFEMTPEVSTVFAGSQITAINAYTGLNNISNTNKCTSYYAFVIEGDQENEPISTSGAFASSKAGAALKISLKNPVTIEAGKTYYIGVYCTATSANDCQVVVDNKLHEGIEGGWVATRPDKNSPWTWDNLSDAYGYVCVSATITGENLPEDMVKAADISVPVRVRAENSFEIGFLYENKASNEVTSIDYTYTVGDNAPVSGTATASKPVPFGGQEVVWIENASYATAGKNEVPVTVTVTKVNGKDNLQPTGTSVTGSTIVMPKDCDNVQNVVVEEATSTGCIYCPYGIIALERIRETYTDGSFIPVAIHWDFSQSSKDPMTVNEFYNLYALIGSGGIPAAIVNRFIPVQMGWIYAFDELQSYYDMLHSAPALTGIDMTCSWENDTRNLTFNVTNKFAFDYDKHNYRLSFVITQDEMGPYNQSNGLRGSGSGTEWDKLPNPVKTTFNDVARQIDTYQGIENSIPATIEAGKEYTYTHKMTMSSAVTDCTKINAICYVIDSKTNEIINAKMVYGKDITGTPSAIEDIIADEDANAPVEYFNLQGIRVANPEGGVFIRRQGNTVTKIVK